MPVRNISGLTNPKPIPGYTIVPPVDTAVHKVTILTSSNEEIDITDLITSASFNLGVITQGNSTIGDFTLNFLDPIKTNYNKISHFNDVYLYGDYSTEATTKRARFKIETIGYTEDCETTLSGRGIGILLSEKSIIYKTTDSFGNLTTKTKSEVIEEILEQNFSEITDFTQIEGDSTLIEKNYEEIPFIDIMEELCGIEHYFYLDHDLVPHYFRKGYHQSDTEAISDVNKVRFTDNSTTLEKVYTKVRVYGKKEGNVPIIATSNIGTSNTNGIEKDYIVTNNSVTTTSQAQDLADEYANNLSDGVKIGKIVSLFLPSLNPGESLFIGLPDEGIDPDYYNISEFSFVIDNGGDFPLTTQLTIEKSKIGISNIIKDTIQIQTENTENDNPNDLDYSIVYNFTEDIGTHTNTQIINGILKLQDGESTGQWVSPTTTLDSNVTEIEPRISGSGLGYINLWVSVDGGLTYKNMSILGKNNSTVISGQDIIFKIVFSSDTSEVESVGLLYKL